MYMIGFQSTFLEFKNECALAHSRAECGRSYDIIPFARVRLSRTQFVFLVIRMSLTEITFLELKKGLNIKAMP